MTMLKRFQYHIVRQNYQEVRKFPSVIPWLTLLQMDNLFLGVFLKSSARILARVTSLQFFYQWFLAHKNFNVEKDLEVSRANQF